ncbi:conserved hypothetical protein [Altererythrobacter sp. B11]|uniref:hypothetical protein n=1 Tax=Altererythrobacter sp. B11 TaxID=2060312 RepID=UPI000DC6FA91|nr:hypothetical protein [Altererythrobacter sp. B11]BBC72320.1 conserved hypothetical protein [Altererythrobacter sp. B11]
MSKNTAGADARPNQRERAEALLASYPDLSPDELEELLEWFRRRASSLDVALVASNERIRRGYSRFRADHVDRFTPRDLLLASLFAGAVLALVIAIGLLGR